MTTSKPEPLYSRRISRSLIAAAIAATSSVTAVVALPGSISAQPAACLDSITYTGATTIDSQTTSADKTTKTATGSMSVPLPTGEITLDYSLSTTYFDPDGDPAFNRFAFAAATPSETEPHTGGVAVNGTPRDSGYTLEVEMSYGNVNPPDAGVGLIMYGQEFSSSNGNSAFEQYAITAMDSSNPAYLFDPAGQLTFNGNPIPATGQPLAAGEAFNQPSIIGNKSLQWYIVLPYDASTFAFTATRGNAWEGFTFTTGAANLCPPVANTKSAAVAVSPVAPAVIDVIAGTATDANNDASSPIAAGTADTDPDGDIAVATVALIDPATDEPATGPVTIAGEGTYEVIDNNVVFTPEAGFSGTTTPIEYEISDEQMLTNRAPIELTVSAAPAAVDDAEVTNVDQPVTLNPVTNDVADPGIDPTTVQFVDPATGTTTTAPVTIAGVGTFSLDAATGDVTFTPAPGYAGPAEIDYYVTDNGGTTVSQPGTISIDVQGPPVGVADSGSAEVDQPVTVSPAANDTDPNGNDTVDPTSLQLIDPSTGLATTDPVAIAGVGTFTVDTATGDVTFTPEAGYIGPATIDYTVTDQYGNLSNPTPINVDIISPPTATADSGSTPATDPITLDVVANDSDLDGSVDPTTVTLIDPATGEAATGPVTIAGEGTYTVDPATGEVTFTPEPTFAGVSTITYTVADNDGNPSDPAPVEITVLGPPIATDDTAITRSDFPVTIDPLGNDSDLDGTLDPTTVTLIDPATGNPATGPVTIAGEGTYTVDPVTGEVTLTPDPSFTGTSTIDYTVADNDGLVSAPATISTEVKPPPVGIPDTDETLTGQSVTINPAANDLDDGAIDPTTVRLIDPTTGTETTGPVTIAGEGTYVLDPATGDVTFTPEAGFTGESTLQYVVDDDEGNTIAPTDITITVRAAPVATDDEARALNAPVTITPTANDSDADGTVVPTSIELIDPVTGTRTTDSVTIAGEGTYVIDAATGDVTFTPEAGFLGLSSIDYVVVDNDGLEAAPATITIDSQLPPVATDNDGTAVGGNPVTLDIVSDDTDGDGTVDPTTVTLIDPATGDPATGPVTIADEGTYVVNPTTGEVTFTPVAGFAGVSTVQYTVDDDQGNTSNLANITVDSQLPPVATNDSDTALGGPVTLNPTDNDTDADGTVDPTTVTLIDPATGNPATGPVTIAGEGTFEVDPATGDVTFTPEAGFTGVSTIDYTVTDDEGNTSAPAEIAIDSQLPPVATDDADTTVDGSPITISPAGNDTDADGTVDPTSVTLIDPATGNPATGPVTIAGEGTFEVDPATGDVTFTPEAGFSGVSTIDYTVTDDQGNTSAPAEIAIDSQLAPVATNASGTALGGPVTLNPTDNDTDADGTLDPTSVTLIDPATGNPATGPVTIAGEGTFEVDPATGEVTFTPEAGFTGVSTIDYTVADDDGNPSNPATITIDSQLPPVAAADTAVSLGQPVTLDTLANDSDDDGTVDATSVTLIDPATGNPATGPVTIAGEGTYVVNPTTGEVTFTPEADFTGVSIIEYTVIDDEGNTSAPATISVDVQHIPEATDDDKVALDGPVTFNPADNDTDDDGIVDTSSVTLIDPTTGNPATGPVTIAGEGTYEVDPTTGDVTFTPEDGFVGTSTIDYTVTDDEGHTSEPGTITVDSQLPPVATDDSGTTLGQPVTIDPTSNDSDPDGNIEPGTVRLIDPATGLPATGPVVIADQGTFEVDPATGEVTFTPEDGFTGETTVEYMVEDDDGNASAVATITIDSQLPPTVSDDAAVTVSEPITINPATNDSDVDGTVDATTVALIDPATGNPATGPVTIAGEGTYEVDPATGDVTFTPEDGFTGVSTIDYTVADDEGNTSAPAELAIEVKAAPALTPDSEASLVGSGPVVANPLSNDVDLDGSIDPSTLTLIDPATGNPATGPVTIAGEGTYEVDPATGDVTFTPEDGFVGTSTIDYTVADDEGHVSEPGTLTVDIQVAPVAEPDTAMAVNGPVTMAPAANDTDSDDTVDPTTLALIDPATGNPATGPVTIAGEGTYEVDPATGDVTFTPESGFIGTSSITYIVRDTDGNPSEPATITVDSQVRPVSVDDETVVATGTGPVSVNPVLNDSDADGSIDPTTVALIDPATGQPTTGPVTIAGEGTYTLDPATGEVTFTPEDGFVGISTIDYTFDDDEGNTSEPATITFEVQAPPVLSDDAAKSENGNAVTISLGENDTSVNSAKFALIDPVTGQATAGPTAIAGVGTWTLEPATGEVTFTPADCFEGVASIDYTATNAAATAADTATIKVTVESDCHDLVASGSTGSGVLAFTGSSTMNMVVGGTLLVLVGAGFMIPMRKRRNAMS